MWSGEVVILLAFCFRHRTKVVSLYFGEHLSMSQIAVEEMIPLGTVKGWIYKFIKDGEEGLIYKKKDKVHIIE